MKNLTLLLFFCLPLVLLSQKPIYQDIQKLNKADFNPVQVLENTRSSAADINELLPDLASGIMFTLQQNNIHQLLERPTSLIKLNMPFPDGSQKIILLQPAHSLSTSFKVTTASGSKHKLANNQGHHYWGVVEGQPQSAVSISVFQGQVMGMILSNNATYLLGPIENDQQQRHILYKEQDLNATHHFTCGVDETPEATLPAVDKSLLAPNPDNCVLMYVEADKDIFDDKGSVAAVTEYLTGLFNQVSLMYFNEQIKLRLNELFVWDTQDPYNSSSTSGLLSDFRENLGSNFTGDLAHLVGYDGGGGIAQLNVLCHPTRHHGYSGINPSFNNIPTYSWSVNVLTHEIGHNLGSPHTHDCFWNGNETPIDRCGIDEGYGTGASCEDGAPLPEAGTIMSYCHLVGGVGMDFTLGFGPQPGDYIRDKVYNANCLVPCDPAPEICNDDFDNDFDGLTDCEDPDCAEYVECLPCLDHIVILTIAVDRFPEETAWTLTDMNGDLVESSNNYSGLAEGTIVIEEFCLLDDCYEFSITDTYGDGICCQGGDGYYTLTTEQGVVLASGNQYGFGETVMLCEGRVPEVCNDGIDNDGDGLIDCEDPECSEESICQPCEDNTVVLQLNYDLYPLETSWAILDEAGEIVIEGIPFETVEQSAFEEKTYCLPDGCYSFVMYDTEGDGMCCQFGQGSYQLINTFGEVLAEGAEFSNEESTDFCIENAACPIGGVYTVTSTADTGLGTLRQGIYCCNASENLDTIVFDLSPTDTLFFETALPSINDDRIMIDGGENQIIQYTGTAALLTINATAVHLSNLELLTPEGSSATAVLSLDNNLNTIIDHCTFENFLYGVDLYGRNTIIQNSNFFIPDYESGIYVNTPAIQTIIRNNLFASPENGYGVYLAGDTIQVNNNEMHDLRAGVYSFHSNRVDIVENELHDNRWGIYVLANTTYGQEHLISKNSLYCNRQDNGIKFLATTNNDHPSPEITAISDTTVQGTAIAGDEVEVFLNDNSDCTTRPCQGRHYLGTAFADPDGNWLLEDVEITLGDALTANATDENHNSSLFSACTSYTLPCVSATIEMKLVSNVICPGDSVQLYFESDVPLDRPLFIIYQINNQDQLLQEYILGDTITNALPAFTVNLFELEYAGDAFECAFDVNTADIEVTRANDDNLSSAYTTALCVGDTLFLQDQTIIEGGEYEVIYPSLLSGCDSIVTVSVEMLPTAQTSEDFQICEGETIEIFGEMVGEAGTYQESYPSEFDCDSIHTIHLEVLPHITTTEERLLCEGDTIILFDEIVTEAGLYSASFMAANNCDSTHQITVELVETQATFATETICEGQSTEIFGEQISEAGVYEATFMAQSGCDSIHQITLEVVESIHTFATEELCAGQSIVIFDETISEAGIYEATFMAQSGCDSIHQITVEMIDSIETFAELRICAGESAEIFGELQTEAGAYSASFTATSGCDSIHTINLEVLSNIQSFDTINACIGQEVVVFGEIYTEDTVVSEQFISVDGCDSTHQVTIIFGEEILTEENMEICPGESVEIFGQEISEAGDYEATFMAQSGCDSTHTVHLAQLESVTTFEEIIICAGETAIIFDETQTEAGTYSESFAAANGCDSIHQIELVVLEHSESFTMLNICAGESIEIFGEEVSEEGMYAESFMAANGCDSTATIQLNVWENPEVEAIVLPSCVGSASGSIELIEIPNENTPFDYQWAHTDENTAVLSELEAGTYAYTITDANGCNSSQSLDIEASSSPSFEMITTDESCANAEDGSIVIESDDTGLEISFEGGSFSNTNTFEGLAEGAYLLEIRNAAGCASTETATITTAEIFAIAEIDITEPSCNGGEDGAISLSLDGVAESPTYEWSNGMSGATIDGLETGIYEVTITANGGCELLESIELEGEAPIESNLQVNIGCGDGQIIAITQPTSGQPPYTIDWSTEQSGLAIGHLVAGFYSLSITDANGCMMDESFEVPLVAPFEVGFNVQDVSCFGEEDGAIDLMIAGGVPPYSISWNNGAITEDLNNLPFGNYAFDVVAADCSFSSEVFVNSPADITTEVLFAPTDNDNMMATAIAQGGTPPYHYQWSNGQTSVSINNLTIGQEIGLTITDSNDCQFEEVYTAIINDIGLLDEHKGIHVFPNPTYDELVIESTSGQSLNYDLQLYNTAGALLMNFADQQSSRQVLSLKALPKGVYLLVFRTKSFTQVRRIVVLE